MGATKSAKPAEVRHDWYEIDATGQVLGRLAVKVAYYLRGKHKTEFTPHVDTGDCIVVTNAKKITVTGNKAEGKIYYSHSGYTGSIKETTFAKFLAKDPVAVIEKAVKGMLPRGPLGRAVLKKLKVYPGNEHPHTAQQPKTLKI